MGNLGFSELVVIFAIALLVIGPKRMPEIARALGEAVRAFRDAMKDDAGDDPTTRLPRRHEADDT